MSSSWLCSTCYIRCCCPKGDHLPLDNQDHPRTSGSGCSSCLLLLQTGFSDPEPESGGQATASIPGPLRTLLPPQQSLPRQYDVQKEAFEGNHSMSWTKLRSQMTINASEGWSQPKRHTCTHSYMLIHAEHRQAPSLRLWLTPSSQPRWHIKAIWKQNNNEPTDA